MESKILLLTLATLSVLVPTGFAIRCYRCTYSTASGTNPGKGCFPDSYVDIDKIQSQEANKCFLYQVKDEDDIMVAGGRGAGDFNIPTVTGGSSDLKIMGSTCMTELCNGASGPAAITGLTSALAAFLVAKLL